MFEPGLLSLDLKIRCELKVNPRTFAGLHVAPEIVLLADYVGCVTLPSAAGTAVYYVGTAA